MQKVLKGVVIQIFGRAFAGVLKMSLEKRYKINEDYAGETFKVINVSPFSIAGTPDPILKKFARNKRVPRRYKVDIQKRFDTICSEAHSDWFIMDNTSGLHRLLRLNKRYYMFPFEALPYDMLRGKSLKKKIKWLILKFILIIPFLTIKPSAEGLSDRLERQYNKFIDIIMRHYDSERIILIRSHVPRFRVDNRRIVKSRHSTKARVFLLQLDEYFARRTECAVIDTPLRFFELCDNPRDQVFLEKQQNLQFAIEQDIKNVIEGRSVKKQGNWESATISDYIADGGSDLRMIKGHFEREKYTFDDLAALFWLYQQSDDQEAYSEIVYAILSNEKGAPYFHTKSMFKRNVDILRDYSYCLIDFDNVEFAKRIVVRLNDVCFLEIDHRGLRTFRAASNKEWNYTRFIENNYTCGIADIDYALGSFEMYFERGRRRCTDPFVLRFDSFDEFMHSLYFVDYGEILDNENYMITFANSDVHVLDYKSKVDLSFFFEEHTRICSVTGGLADQIKHVVFYNSICDENNLKLYYQDLPYDRDFIFAGMDASEITTCGIEQRRLSSILSNKLRLEMLRQPHAKYPLHSNINWYSLGLREAFVVILDEGPNYERNLTQLKGIPFHSCKSLEEYKDIIADKHPVQHLICTGTPGYGRTVCKEAYEKHFTFPDIIPMDVRNHEVLHKIYSTYPVALHIRRGVNIECDNKRYNKGYLNYNKAIEMVYTQEPFSRKENKHLFVFSDDMEYARANAEELGLYLAGGNITYVDWNHHYNNFRDMQLISLCKVIIRGIGGFAWTAGMISKTVDCIIRVDYDDAWKEWERS